MTEIVTVISTMQDELFFLLAFSWTFSTVAYLIAKCKEEDEGEKSSPILWGAISIISLLAWIGIVFISPINYDSNRVQHIEQV